MKELIKKLTEHYAWCIENMPEINYLVFCSDNYIEGGICWCSFKKFNQSLHNTVFFRKIHEKNKPHKSFFL